MTNGQFKNWLNRTAPNTDGRTWAEVIALAVAGSTGTTTGLTAFAAGGQGSATILVAGFNEITTAASPGASVKLPTAAANTMVIAKNDGANYIDVFPNTSDTIDDGAANAAIRLYPGQEIIFFAVNTTNWESSAQAGGPLLLKAATGINAFAGGGQASATQLIAAFNEVVNVGTAGDSVKLLPALANQVQIVKNDGANYLNVFPSTGDTIDDGGADIPIRVYPSETVVFFAVDSTNWESDKPIDILFIKENDHIIGIAPSSTANAPGGNFFFNSGDGTGNGDGGFFIIRTGVGGTGSIGSGLMQVQSGNSTGTQESGAATFKSGSAVNGNTGVVTLESGDSTNGNSGDVRVGSGVAGSSKGKLLFKIGGVDCHEIDSNSDFGAILNSGAFNKNSYLDVTAFAGGGQASATALINQFNNVTVVATDADSVKLPVAFEGRYCIIKNSSSNILAVFPVTGGTIDGGAANASISIQPGHIVVFQARSSTAWISDNPASGTVNQGTNITTGVTLNTLKGLIVTQTATAGAGGATPNTFTVTNSQAKATSHISAYIMNYAGTIATNGNPIVQVDNRANGAFDIIISNCHSANALNGALEIGFEIKN